MPTPARIQIVPQYISELRSISGIYTGYIPNSYADKVSVDSFYEVLQNDPVVGHAMHLLSIMTIGEYYEIECEDARLKIIVKEALQTICDFTHVQKSLVMGAVLFGLGIQRKYYTRKKLSGIPGEWTVVDRIQEVDRRRLMIERDVEDRNKTYWTMYSLKDDKYIILFDRSENKNVEDGEAVQDYIWYIHEWEELNPFFRGLGDCIFQLAYIKTKAMQYWADNAESWAKPIIAFTTDLANKVADASLGAGFVSADAAANQILSEVEKMRARYSFVLNNRDKIDFHEHGSTGSNIIAELIAYCDTQIRQLILGAELTTQSGQTGSYGQAAVHRQATDSVILYNRNRIAEVLEEYLINDFVYRNRLQLHALRIKPQRVKIKLKVQDEEMKRQEMAKQQGGRNYPSQKGSIK